MKKILLIISILIFCLINPAWATPPSSIELTYDPQKGNLHIEIAHAAHDPREHHIRKVEVYLNDEKPIDLYFASQTKPSALSIDIALKARAGDNIRVLAICNQAGRREETLIVPDEDDKASQNIETPQPEKKPKDVPQKRQSSY